MKQFSDRIVEAFGSWWPLIGWTLFAAALFMPLFAIQDDNAMAVWYIASALFMVWWNADTFYQCVPFWMIALGLAMIAIGLAGHMMILPIACWVIYWTKVRE